MKQIIPIKLAAPSLGMLAAVLSAGLLAVPSAALTDTPISDSGPEVTAASCVLMEQETGTLLLAKNQDEQYEPASVTKIMTMLLVMEAFDSGRLAKDDIITTSSYAAAMAGTNVELADYDGDFTDVMGGSQVYLKEGEQFTAWEMLKCVAVASGNDAAVALAEHLAGSEDAFVDQMNQRAKELGMENTHFENCTGLPARGHLTTAYDIALMSRELMANHPEIQELTTIWMDSVRNGEFGLTNTNRLVRFYPGATGLKTGSTDSALFCLSATAHREGMDLIAVVLKAPTGNDRFNDAKALLDYGFANYAVTTAYPDGPLPPVDVLLGASAQVQPALSRECRLLIPKGSEGAVTTRISLRENVEAPVEPGQTLGTMEVYLDGVLQDSVPITATAGVARLGVGDLFLQMLRQLLMA